MDGLVARGETALAKDFTVFCLQLFAEIFSGEQLTAEEEELFVTYNAGLFALTSFTPAFFKAKKARETLETNMQGRFEAARDAGKLPEARYNAPNLLSQATNLDGTPYSSYQIGYGITQFIWGAYIETASLMSSTVIALRTRPAIAASVRAEASALVSGASGMAKWQLPYTSGALSYSPEQPDAFTGCWL